MYDIPRWLTPPRLLLASFGLLILLGSAVLYADRFGEPGAVSYLDCLFTSTSAVCVTGLITVDTATAWTPWGQGVILVLIQLGGLGIMTFGVALTHLAGRKPSSRSHLALRGALGNIPGAEVGGIIRDIFLYTFILEGLGAAVLTYRFSADHAFPEALAQGVFHSVSAFCNAGFSLFSTNLVEYAGDPLVNLSVMGLIVAGGLGFLVLRELRGHLPLGRAAGRPRRLSLHARLVLWSSLHLIWGGALAMFLLEYFANDLSVWGGTGWTVLFTSITPRTAGFNTLDPNILSNGSLLVIIVLMFVGASPGSCGGGVKTTTMATLTALVRTRMRGRPGAETSGRTIPEQQVAQALTLVLFSIAFLITATLVLISFGLPGDAQQHEKGNFLMLLFEAVSAFGTVGLSLGATPMLAPLGKVVIILLMFVGRLGPLTLAYSLGQKVVEVRYRPAEERIMLG